MLLAIDSSAGTGVALLDDATDPAGVVLAAWHSADTRGHAESIGTAIDSVLREAGVAPGSVDRVAVGMGPGPFTGLRVGIAAARAFALGASARLLPVVSHDAIAFADARAVLVVTDARRREVYWSTYRAREEGAMSDSAAEETASRETAARRRITGPALAKPDELATAVDGYEHYVRLDDARVDAGDLGRLALAIDARGGEFATSEPLYLRSPDVTLSTPKRVAS